MYERLAKPQLEAALADTPAVVVQGPRQCGKTTLVRQFSGSSVPYVTLDDALALDAATRNPDAFIAQFPDQVVIDEAQRAPKMFLAIKKAIDADRRPGRFLLTGSSNVLLLPRMSESLAGRMETVPLWPLAQCEVRGTSGAFVQSLFGQSPEVSNDGAPFALSDIVCRGGFPEPMFRASSDRARAWFESYVRTVTELDVRDISDIEGLTAMPRLLRVLARHCGETLNVSRISSEVGIPHTTLTRYLALLESVFVLRPISAWTDAAKSAKTSKLMFSDPGVLSYLLGVEPSNALNDEATARRIVECFVCMEVLRTLPPFYRLLHFRSLRTWSVPIVVEAPDGRIVGIDVCLDETPSPSAFRGLEVLQDVAGERFARGVVLHTGEGARQVSERLSAYGVASLWA